MDRTALAITLMIALISALVAFLHIYFGGRQW
jgi:hypothetical protein